MKKTILASLLCVILFIPGIAAAGGKTYGMGGEELSTLLVENPSVFAGFVTGVRDSIYSSENQASQGMCASSEVNLHSIFERIMGHISRLRESGSLEKVRAYLIVSSSIQEVCGSPKVAP